MDDRAHPIYRRGQGRHDGTRAGRMRQVARVMRAGGPASVSLLLSDQARMILTRRYDAFTTDRAYENFAHGWLGPLGRVADRRVMAMPVHVALRERLQIVAGMLVEAIGAAAPARVRVLSAPCALIRDLTTAVARLSGARVELTAADLDELGDVLPEARRRAAAAGLDVAFVRGDLLDGRTEDDLSARGPYDIVSCIGLTAWIELEEVGELGRRFHRLLSPGGSLLVDSWRQDSDAMLARALGLPVHYHDPIAFGGTLERAGFRVVDSRSTTRAVNTLWALRRR